MSKKLIYAAIYLVLFFAIKTDASCPKAILNLSELHRSFASLSSLTESYGSISRKEWIQGLVALYPELNSLLLKVDSSPERRNIKPHAEAASVVLFGETAVTDGDYSEFDSTISFIELLLKAKRGDYIGFAGPNPKITRESFQQLSDFVNRLTPTSEHLDAAIVSAVLHDLGKIKMFDELVSSFRKEDSLDHDEVLFHAISSIPVLTISNARLRPDLRQLNIDSFDTGGFELPQFVQGENLAYHCQKLSSMKLEAFDWMVLRSIFDVAGAAGGQAPTFSPVMVEPVFQNYWKTYLFIRERLERGVPGQKIYWEFLEDRGRSLGYDMTSPLGFAQTRVALWNRVNKAGEESKMIAEAFRNLPEGARNILVAELTADGIENPATFLYYSPAFSIKMQKVDRYKDNKPGAFAAQLNFFFRLFFKARKFKSQSKITLVTLNKTVSLMDKDFDLFHYGEMSLESQGGDKFTPKFTPMDELRSASFEALSSADELPGKNIVVFTIGGGSDILRAEELGWITGKNLLAQVSIVRNPNRKTDLTPSLQNHGGEVFKEVLRITPETKSGSLDKDDPYARLFEPIAAVSGYSTYRITTEVDIPLAQQAQAVLDDLPVKPDAIYLVDAGGDSYKPAGSPFAASTDQDARVLQFMQPLAAWNPEISFYTAVLAPGLDAPLGIAKKLVDHGAWYLKLSSAAAEKIIKTREAQVLPFSRVTDSWLAALRGGRGWYISGLPESAINNPNGKGNPVVYLHELTPGLLLMRYADHLKLIGAQDVSLPKQNDIPNGGWVLTDKLASRSQSFSPTDGRKIIDDTYRDYEAEVRQVLKNDNRWIESRDQNKIAKGQHVIGIVQISKLGKNSEVTIFEGISLGEKNIAGEDERPFYATIIQTRDSRQIELTASRIFRIFTSVR